MSKWSYLVETIICGSFHFIQNVAYIKSALQAKKVHGLDTNTFPSIFIYYCSSPFTYPHLLQASLSGLQRFNSRTSFPLSCSRQFALPFYYSPSRPHDPAISTVNIYGWFSTLFHKFVVYLPSPDTLHLLLTI